MTSPEDHDRSPQRLGTPGDRLTCASGRGRPGLSRGSPALPGDGEGGSSASAAEGSSENGCFRVSDSISLNSYEFSFGNPNWPAEGKFVAAQIDPQTSMAGHREGRFPSGWPLPTQVSAGEREGELGDSARALSTHVASAHSPPASSPHRPHPRALRGQTAPRPPGDCGGRRPSAPRDPAVAVPCAREADPSRPC